MPVSPRNLSAYSKEVPTKAIGGNVTLASQVPPVVLPMETPAGTACGPQARMDPGGIEPPGPTGVEQTRELLKWEHMFACSDLDLGQNIPD